MSNHHELKELAEILVLGTLDPTDRERLDKSQKERRRLEGELETLQGKGSKYQDQLMEVKSNEAYRAMLKEIAHATGEPLGTVKSRITRGMARMRESLGGVEVMA